MKKNRRMKNIGISTNIIKGGIITVIDNRRTITKDSMGRGQMDMIDIIGTNVVMTRGRKMIGLKRHTKNIVNHPGITGDFNKTGMSKSYPWRRLHRREWREVSPASIVSYANNPNIMQHSVHIARAKKPP